MEYGTPAGQVRALSPLSLRAAAGEFVAVTGVSGSGKSTLLAILGGLLRPTSGSLVVDGVDVVGLDDDGLSRYRREMSTTIFQEFNLMSMLTMVENVALPLEIAGVSRPLARVRAVEALRQLGIGELAGRFPGEVSGGQRQRAAVARAFASGRKLVLADEPTASLDAANTAMVVDGLLQLRRVGATVVVASHDPEVARGADQRIALRDGVQVATA